jgi:heat-inducible transcriptional repressor
MLDDRRAKVLEALVEEYIATGLPVSSQAILDRSGVGVSSATVRNDLAQLESYGFVSQPHTSAGRIPTPQGYRYYVDHASPARLRSATRTRIEVFFADVHSQLNRLLKDTTGLLADISHYPAVVIGPGFAGELVRAVHLVALGERVMIVVTVSMSGRVSQTAVRTKAQPSSAEIEDAERLLSAAFEGNAIQSGVDTIGELIPDAASERVRSLVTSVVDALEGVDATTRELFIGGTAQLAELWQDLAHVHRILALLEQETTVRKLIGDESDATTVRLSNEIDVSDLDLAVVSSPYDAGEHGSGRVAVLGPMRMDYRRTIKIVEEVGDNLGDSLGR